MKKLLVLISSILILSMMLVACESSDDESKKSKSKKVESQIDEKDERDDEEERSESKENDDAKGVESNDDNTEEAASKVAQVNADGIPYKLPVDAGKVDKKAKDPSNKDIQFKFDSENRLTSCLYKVDGTDVMVTYTYSGKQIQIYAFSGEIIAAAETFTVKNYNKDAGIITHGGYYFSGCEF